MKNPSTTYLLGPSRPPAARTLAAIAAAAGRRSGRRRSVPGAVHQRRAGGRPCSTTRPPRPTASWPDREAERAADGAERAGGVGPAAPGGGGVRARRRSTWSCSSIAAAPDLDARFEKAYGYLHDDVTRRRASIGLALELCGASLLSGGERDRFGTRRPAGAVRARRGRGPRPAGADAIVAGARRRASPPARRAGARSHRRAAADAARPDGRDRRRRSGPGPAVRLPPRLRAGPPRGGDALVRGRRSAGDRAGSAGGRPRAAGAGADSPPWPRR